MLKLNIVIVILLISIGTVSGMHDKPAIEVAHANGSTGDFNLGEDVYLVGTDFKPGDYSYEIYKDGDPENPVKEGGVTADDSKSFYEGIWYNILSGATPGGYIVEVREGMCGIIGCGHVATAYFTIIADPTTEIPEFPTVAIPADYRAWRISDDTDEEKEDIKE